MSQDERPAVVGKRSGGCKSQDSRIESATTAPSVTGCASLFPLIITNNFHLMDVSLETMTAVVQAVLGPGFNDPELHQKAGLLAQVADVLKCDPASARNGFLNELLDLNADLLAQTEKQKVIERQKDKLKELDAAKDELKKQLSISKDSLSESEISRLKKKIEDLNRRFHAEHKAIKAAEKQLEDVGYKDELSDARLNKLMTREADLRQEVSQLKEQVAHFEGVEATTASFMAKIADMRIRIENIGSLYDSEI